MTPARVVVAVILSFAAGGTAALSGPPARGPERHALQESNVDRGKQTFMRVGCYQCHGREAQGASSGPRLGPNPLPLAAFTRAIRTPRNEMPPYSVKLLSDAELADLHAFAAARPRPHELPK